MFFNITVRRVSWPAFTFSISIRYFFALRSAASLSAAVGFYRSSSRHASYLRIRNNRRSRILRLALLLQARQSRGERGVAESRSTRQPPLLEATLEGREKQYQNLKNLNGYPRNRLESSGPWRNWVWRRSFHPDSLEDQQAERDGGLPARERGTVELFNRFDGSSQSLEQRKSHEKGKGSR